MLEDIALLIEQLEMSGTSHIGPIIFIIGHKLH